VACLTIQSNSSMHCYEFVALCKDISLQRGQFCARSLASHIPRSSEDRSSWMFLIQIVRGRPGGRLQFSGGGSKMVWIASAYSSVRARCPKKVRRRDLMMGESGGWLVMRRMSDCWQSRANEMSRILCRKKGLLREWFFLNWWIFGKVTRKSVVASCILHAWPTLLKDE